MWVSTRQWRWAEPAAKFFAIVSVLLFLTVVVVLMGFRKEAMNEVGKTALGYMLLFILVSMAVGWFMGGPAKETRAVLATVTGTRHAVLCLLMALYAFPHPAVQTALVAFSALMLPPNLLFTGYMVVCSRKASRATANTDQAVVPEVKRL
jgi:bile acid:Na+ symporter, BASS family